MIQKYLQELKAVIKENKQSSPEQMSALLTNIEIFSKSNPSEFIEATIKEFGMKTELLDSLASKTPEGVSKVKRDVSREFHPDRNAGHSETCNTFTQILNNSIEKTQQANDKYDNKAIPERKPERYERGDESFTVKLDKSKFVKEHRNNLYKALKEGHKSKAEKKLILSQCQQLAESAYSIATSGVAQLEQYKYILDLTAHNLGKIGIDKKTFMEKACTVPSSTRTEYLKTTNSILAKYYLDTANTKDPSAQIRSSLNQTATKLTEEFYKKTQEMAAKSAPKIKPVEIGINKQDPYNIIAKVNGQQIDPDRIKYVLHQSDIKPKKFAAAMEKFAKSTEFSKLNPYQVFETVVKKINPDAKGLDTEKLLNGPVITSGTMSTSIGGELIDLRINGEPINVNEVNSKLKQTNTKVEDFTKSLKTLHSQGVMHFERIDKILDRAYEMSKPKEQEKSKSKESKSKPTLERKETVYSPMPAAPEPERKMPDLGVTANRDPSVMQRPAQSNTNQPIMGTLPAENVKKDGIILESENGKITKLSVNGENFDPEKINPILQKNKIGIQQFQSKLESKIGSSNGLSGILAVNEVVNEIIAKAPVMDKIQPTSPVQTTKPHMVNFSDLVKEFNQKQLTTPQPQAQAPAAKNPLQKPQPPQMPKPASPEMAAKLNEMAGFNKPQNQQQANAQNAAPPPLPQIPEHLKGNPVKKTPPPVPPRPRANAFSALKGVKVEKASGVSTPKPTPAAKPSVPDKGPSI